MPSAARLGAALAARCVRCRRRSRARQLAAARGVRGFGRRAHARRSATSCGASSDAVLEGDASRECWARACESARRSRPSPVVWRMLGAAAPRRSRVLERLAPDRYLLDWGGGAHPRGAPPERDAAPRARRVDERPCHAVQSAGRRARRRRRCSSRKRRPSPPWPSRLKQRVRSARHPEPRPDGLKDASCKLASPPAQLERSRRRGQRADLAQVRALRLLHGDVPDLRAARRRAR